MAVKKKVVKKSGTPTPLQLAHAQRSAESKRVAKMTPAQRTAELAPEIVSKAVKAIRKVGVLGSAKVNTGTQEKPDWAPKYTLSMEQKDRILSTLRYEVEQLDGRLTPGEGKAKKGSEFTF